DLDAPAVRPDACHRGGWIAQPRTVTRVVALEVDADGRPVGRAEPVRVVGEEVAVAVGGTARISRRAGEDEILRGVWGVDVQGVRGLILDEHRACTASGVRTVLDRRRLI